MYFDHDFDNPEAPGTYFYIVNTFIANLSSFVRVQRAAVLLYSAAAEGNIVGVSSAACGSSMTQWSV